MYACLENKLSSTGGFISDLRHITQSNRVSVGLDGKLYFSHVTQADSLTNYSCLAAFSRIRHMSQRTPISLKILNSKNNFLNFQSKVWCIIQLKIKDHSTLSFLIFMYNQHAHGVTLILFLFFGYFHWYLTCPHILSTPHHTWNSSWFAGFQGQSCYVVSNILSKP